MERRSRSIEALEKLIFIDSLDEEELKAQRLQRWYQEYLEDKQFLETLDLQQNELIQLSELFYKNINFLKKHLDSIGIEMSSLQKRKSFFQN